MSRRIKLLITALFLVLLGIPTIYVALTWHPPNPLRFRMVGVKLEPKPTHDGFFMVAGFEIEVINTSSTPIGLGLANFHRSEGDTSRVVGFIDEKSGTVVEGHIDEDHMLSGNGRFHFKGWTEWPKEQTVDHNHLRVKYDFISHTKWEFRRKYWSLCKLLPETWRDRMPMPDISLGEAPLEPAP